LSVKYLSDKGYAFSVNIQWIRVKSWELRVIHFAPLNHYQLLQSLLKLKFYLLNSKHHEFLHFHPMLKVSLLPLRTYTTFLQFLNPFNIFMIAMCLLQFKCTINTLWKYYAKTKLVPTSILALFILKIITSPSINPSSSFDWRVFFLFYP